VRVFWPTLREELAGGQPTRAALQRIFALQCKAKWCNEFRWPLGVRLRRRLSVDAANHYDDEAHEKEDRHASAPKAKVHPPIKLFKTGE
jgi:hypothetical protein